VGSFLDVTGLYDAGLGRILSGFWLLPTHWNRGTYDLEVCSTKFTPSLCSDNKFAFTRFEFVVLESFLICVLKRGRAIRVIPQDSDLSIMQSYGALAEWKVKALALKYACLSCALSLRSFQCLCFVPSF
jgi:hypothetical protein